VAPAGNPRRVIEVELVKAFRPAMETENCGLVAPELTVSNEGETDRLKSEAAVTVKASGAECASAPLVPFTDI